MKTYYCVKSLFFNDGKVKAICYPVEGTEKPKDEYHSTARSDVYCDYFDTYDEAQAYLKDCQRA